MEMLKLFATCETALSPTLLVDRLRNQGWQITTDDNGFRCATGELTLWLEPSGDDLFLLRGEASRYPSQETAALLAFLRDDTDHFQLDVFEEDGRLIRRVSSADSTDS